MKNKYKLYGFILITIIISFSLFNNSSKESTTNATINSEKLAKLIKNKKYTIVFYWAEWCGLSRKALLNDFIPNYKKYNNDTVQALWIVMSDTAKANKMLKENKSYIPYYYFKADKYPSLIKNYMDEKNKLELIEDICNIKYNGKGFPDLFLINNKSQIIRFSTTMKAFNEHFPTVAPLRWDTQYFKVEYE